MPRLERIQLETRTVSPEDFNRLQTAIERALGKLAAENTASLRIINTILGGLAGGLSYDLGNSILGNSLGTERVEWQRRVQTGAAGASLTLALLCDAKSATGTAYVRLRLGGGDRVADGTVVLTMTVPVSGTAYGAQLIQVTVPAPGGMQRLKLTVQSSAAASLAQVKDGCVVCR